MDQPAVVSDAIVNSLAGLSSDRARQQFLVNCRSLLDPSVAQGLQDIAQSAMQMNSRRALAIASAAVLIAHELHRAELVAHGTRIKANVLCTLGKYKQALRLYQHAVALFRGLGDRKGIARTLSASIQPMILLGKYRRALLVASEARHLLAEEGDVRRLAMLENNVANIYHRQDRFEEALIRYQSAYELLIPFRDPEKLLICFNNLAMCLISLNDFPRAMEIYQTAQRLSRTENMPILRAITEYNIAYLFFLRGQYRQAIAILDSTRKLCEEICNPHLTALCYLDLSEIYVELNLSEEAVAAAEEARQRFLKLGLSYEVAKATVNEAIANGQLRRSARSIELFCESRCRFIEDGNPVWPHLIDLYQAVVIAQQGNHAEAYRRCLDAAAFFDSGTIPTKKVYCHLLLGRLSLSLGNYSNARTECARALRTVRTIDAPSLRYQCFLLLGVLEQARSFQRVAYNAFQKARTELELLRTTLDQDDMRIAFMKDKSTVYESLVKLCLADRTDERARQEAFGYVEMGKSQSLMEGLHLRELTRKIGKAQGETCDIGRLNQELSWFQRRIELEQLRPSEKTPDRVQTLERQVQERRSALRQISQRSSSDREEKQFTSQKSASLSLDEIRRDLPREVTLLEYFSVGDEILAAVIERNVLRVESLTTFSRSVPLLRALRFQLEKAESDDCNCVRHTSVGLEATRSHLEELYRELISPVREMISGSHLVVVPHGALHGLPFHALRDGERDLIDSFTVSYAPSASAFALCQERKSCDGSVDLILGVPDARAPRILEEAQAVHALLPNSKLLIGDQATRAALEDLGRGSRFIHIATHGIFRPANPLFSGVWMGDCFLSVCDLLEMDLPADLIVLSGCATGVNVVAGCDEQLGLSRGVLLAGVRSALLTLWNVDDRSTTLFMQSFYKELARSGNKAVSYRQALTELRSHYVHPYHWAPFYLTGAVC
jgi:CHAT domain-containing protein/tetratricopeptide (TPR) repeat protein